MGEKKFCVLSDKDVEIVKGLTFIIFLAKKKKQF